ncbi:MAG: hypothetical protein L0Y58_16685 [Verrucomicrobia subdivision 3 bacterium]|nr:hypothetical protein [Limisphaerales bacterium]
MRLPTCLPAAGSVAQRLSGSNGRQLDLGFRARPRPRQQLLRSRAKFWFDQMRRVVDAAVEWKPAPLPRPEQGMLDLTRKTEVTLAK